MTVSTGSGSDRVSINATFDMVDRVPAATAPVPAPLPSIHNNENDRRSYSKSDAFTRIVHGLSEKRMQIAVLYVGSSLLAPLRNAEREIKRHHGLDLRVATWNFGAAFTEEEWRSIENDLREAEVLFVIHVMDGENAARLMPLLDILKNRHRAVVVINCMPELMKRTRMGKLDFEKLPGSSRKGLTQPGTQSDAEDSEQAEKATGLLRSVVSWIGRQAKGTKGHSETNGQAKGHGRAQYLKFANRLPALLRFVPGAGALRDVKNYLMMFCYFLQPTPANIRAMLLYALKHYVDDERVKDIKIAPPESMPAVAIYHPDAPALFESFNAYESWYSSRQREKVKRQNEDKPLNPKSTVGLLLMRPQIVSNARKHYDGLIRAIEAEGLSVIPAISTLMDNREACEKFLIEPLPKVQGPKSKVRAISDLTDNGQLTTDKNARSRVSQIVSLTGFSFVGGPAMNDSEAAAEFLTELNVPIRSMVSLDTQTIESWRESFAGLNPVQTGMQIAIPEIDGATEPFVFGGITAGGVEPAPLEDRCLRIARRLKRWNRLQTADRDQLKIALTLYCFPPNKGNIGTAADLDVFASLFDLLGRVKSEGYRVDPPESIDRLRDMLLNGNSEALGATAKIEYRMSVDEYRRLCPFVNEIETEWGPAPGKINSFGGDLLIQGITLGNVFIGLQPTFGFEDDPMRLLMAKGGSPHHGFAAFYTYLEKVFEADVVVHVGTHGAMEFMPGKQVGLSGACWPDRLIGELPNVYIYSVNNPSEGTIAKRRSYAELISYLTPPIENAGLYRELASLKDLIGSYRRTADEDERTQLFAAIDQQSRELNFNPSVD
jgi:magnesium chelatase subunit H